MKFKYHLYEHKEIKSVGINLTKDVQNLFNEDYKTLLRKIKSDLHKQRYTMFMDLKI